MIFLKRYNLLFIQLFTIFNERILTGVHLISELKVMKHQVWNAGWCSLNFKKKTNLTSEPYFRNIFKNIFDVTFMTNDVIFNKITSFSISTL